MPVHENRNAKKKVILEVFYFKTSAIKHTFTGLREIKPSDQLMLHGIEERSH